MRLHKAEQTIKRHIHINTSRIRRSWRFVPTCAFVEGHGAVCACVEGELCEESADGVEAHEGGEVGNLDVKAEAVAVLQALVRASVYRRK